MINSTNFMDGLDGLVPGSMAVAIASLAFAQSFPWPLFSLLGSLLAFIVWNWSPAKVFLGDVGSTFLGSIFAGLVLQSPTFLEALGYLLVASPLMADALICLLRRLFNGQRVFCAHRLHFFQHLHQAGWSHSRVSLTYIFGTAVMAASMLLGGWLLVSFMTVVLVLIGYWLEHRFAVPFHLASDK